MTPAPECARAARATAVPVGALAVVVGALGWASLPWPLVHDAPILHYIARRVAEGAVPYRDLFDMNQPGAYLLHLAVVRGLGDGDLAWRAFDLGWLALTALVAWRFARPWGRTASVGAALLLAAYHLAGGAWQTGQRDFLLCVFLLGGAALAAGWLERPGGVGRPGLAGLVLGAGIAMKPHAALFAAGLGALLAVAARRRAGVVPALAGYGAGLVVVPALALGWVAARGGLGAWREIVFGYLVPLYSRLGRAEDWVFWRSATWIALGAAVLLSVAAAAWRRRWTWRHAIGALGVAYGVLHFVGQGKGWEYHLYPLAAFSAVLAFAEIERLLGEGRLAAAIVVGASLAATIGLLALRGSDTVNAGWIWDKERVVRQLVRDVAGRRRPGDEMQVLDTTEGGVHALLRLGMRQPTRFVYDFHFFHDTDHPTIRRLRAELVAGLAARPPRFVALFTHGWPAGGVERVRTFPELSRFLETGYAIAERRPAYVLLEKR